MDLKEFDFSGDNNTNRHPWELARLSFIMNIFSYYSAGFCRNNAYIADLGCGDTFIVRALASRYPFYNFIGVDTGFNANIIDLMSKVSYPENITLSDTLPEASLSHGSICCVLMLDLLEHIADDKEYLVKLSNNSRLASNAGFIITVPAFTCLFSSHDILLRHFRRYTVHKLSTLVTKADLRILECEYIFHFPLIWRIVEKNLERLKFRVDKKETDVSSWRGRPVLTSILSKLLYHESNMSRFFNKNRLCIPGLTCYIVCQKSV